MKTSTEIYGYCGAEGNEENVMWVYDDMTKTLTISGTGNMMDYYSPWSDYDVSKAIIKEGVTNISSEAFYQCDNLKSITIPKSVTSIGTEAFYGCNILNSITISDGVTSIGYGAFEFCEVLTCIKIPNSVTSIGEYAFFGCRELKSFCISKKC